MTIVDVQMLVLAVLAAGACCQAVWTKGRLYRLAHGDWWLVALCLVVFLAVLVRSGYRPAVFVGLAAMPMLYFHISVPKGLLRRRIGYAAGVIVVGFAFSFYGAVASGSWQIGAETFRTRTKEYIARKVAAEMNETLVRLAEDDTTSYEAGPLFETHVWELYGSRIEAVPGYVLECGYLSMLRGEPAWHSSVTGLYRVREVKGFLFFVGGVIGSRNVISIRHVKSDS